MSMCGIVGYVGSRPAYPVLTGGLERLEYRGYDSAGLAVLGSEGMVLRKREGRLASLTGAAGDGVAGSTGIGHTRWATHGKPSDVNAHPHSDCSGSICVVHNGIIENHLYLRNWLLDRGHRFLSETDTEVIPHLIEDFYNGDLFLAVKQAIARLEGSYAVVILHEEHPGELVIARQDSPLVVGLGKGENYVASDIPAVLPYTKSVYVLDDGELGVVRADSTEIYDKQGNRVEKDIYTVEWDAGMAEKGGFEDFMLKEIHEQPQAVRSTLKGKIAQDMMGVLLEGVKLREEDLLDIKKVYIVACGTAWHAGLVGKRLIEELVHLSVEADIASEFRYRNPLVDDHTLAVIISQSGETADTLAGLREARRRGARIIAITNVVGSSIAREAENVIYTWAGPEIAVASTKAYITQLVSLYLLAVFLGQKRGAVSPDQAGRILSAVTDLPAGIEKMLQTEDHIKALADSYGEEDDVFFTGRGLDYEVAREGALKLKEISYIHAEAYAAGELKHGTLALVVEGTPVFALATQPHVYDKMISNIEEVKARGASVVAIARSGDNRIEQSADDVIYTPEVASMVSPVLAAVPLQLFAYYAAKHRSCDVDKPRNLAKSVTVE